MLLLRICKVKCDWSIRPDVTEIFRGSSSQPIFFGGDKQQREIGLHSQAIAGLSNSLFGSLYLVYSMYNNLSFSFEH